MVSDNMIIHWGKNERKLGVGLHKSLYIFYMVCVKETLISQVLVVYRTQV